MAFIRIQKLKKDETGKILSGSATIIDVKYEPDAKYHAQQKVREKLGKVIELYSKRCGLFQSPTRGLVVYDADTDSFSSPLTREAAEEQIKDEKIIEQIFPSADVHTVFGDVYLLAEVLKNSGLWDVLCTVFPEKVTQERLLCHLMYGFLRDGSKISCEDFIAKSFISYCVRDLPLSSLKSDTRYFSAMGEDSARMAFFRAYCDYMKKQNPSFGKGCFVDSTPLPNSIDSPFNALCSHGLASTSVQMRLVMVLDEETLLPIWYDVIPGNILDISTLKTISKDVEVSLGITIHGYTLDAGYASKELVMAFELQKEEESIPEKKYLVRMPSKRGYPYRELYQEFKEQFNQAKYCFVRGGHIYFGKAVTKVIFGTPVRCYVYVDKYNALKGNTSYMMEHPEEYEALTNREKNWYQVKFGYFVLIANYLKTPAQMLDDYFSRTNIETSFKTDKEYLKLLPLCKWSDLTVRGKILSDVIDSIIRSKIQQIRKGSVYSMSAMIGKCQSLMCFRDQNTEQVYVEVANKQVRICYEELGVTVPQKIDLKSYMTDLFDQKL